MEEFGDDFSVVLQGASLCLHHPCLCVWRSLPRGSLKIWNSPRRDEKKRVSEEQDDEGGSICEKWCPLLLLLFCQLSKEDKLMPLERSPPERRGRVKILNLNVYHRFFLNTQINIPKYVCAYNFEMRAYNVKLSQKKSEYLIKILFRQVLKDILRWYQIIWKSWVIVVIIMWVCFIPTHLKKTSLFVSWRAFGQLETPHLSLITNDDDELVSGLTTVCSSLLQQYIWAVFTHRLRPKETLSHEIISRTSGTVKPDQIMMFVVLSTVFLTTTIQFVT